MQVQAFNTYIYLVIFSILKLEFIMITPLIIIVKFLCLFINHCLININTLIN